MNTATVPAPVSLARDRSLYTFTPQPARGVVALEYVGPWTTRRLELPTGEARELWARLRRKGFSPF